MTPIRSLPQRACRWCPACLIGVLLLVLPACRTAPKPSGEDAQWAMLALLMPSRIEIVEPFTRVRSFDDDPEPDGIELLLRAVNALDDPGLMIVGDLRAELYEYVPASADPKGRQLERWQISLATDRDQRRYWNQLTQMYELMLEVNPQKVPRADRYVLLVTYNSPLGDHLSDEFVMGEEALGGGWKGFQPGTESGGS